MPDHTSPMQQGLEAYAKGDMATAAALLFLCPEKDTDPSIAHKLGVALAEQAQNERAIQIWRRGLRLDATHPDILLSLAQTYSALGDGAAAELTFMRLIDHHPNHGQARFGYGNLLFRLGRTEEAIAMYAPLTDNPDPPRGILVNLGRALRRLGRLNEADACYRRALITNPDDHFTHWNRAHTLFLQGQWADGFAAWEHRLHTPYGPPFFPACADWNGDTPVDNLLVLAEQGHGDTLQCLRYLAQTQHKARSVTLAAHSALLPLIQVLLPCVRVLDFATASHQSEAFDAWVPLFSLPHRLGCPAPQSVPEPAQHPAFAAGIGAIRQHADPAPGRPCIGLTWAGNHAHDNDHWRSIDFSCLAPLVARHPNIVWRSLQVGPQAEVCQTAGIPPMSLPRDFLETAQRLIDLDCVITVDTAVAHLAGLLGVPVWILLAAEPDWRWQQTGPTSPWYASARLFRQNQLGNWSDVIAEIDHALVAL